MHTFFLVSGFFGALLYYRKGPHEMMMNRVFKILLPLIVFTLILNPVIYLARVYAELKMIGSSDAWSEAWTTTVDHLEFLPNSLMHLWFLYYLMAFSVIFWVASGVLHRLDIPRNQIRGILNVITGSPILRIALLFSLYFTGLWLNGEYDIHTNVSLWPDWRLMLCYLLFYSFGWAVFITGNLSKLNWHPLILTGAGLALYIITNLVKDYPDPAYQLVFQQVTYALTTVLLSLGITGFFLKYLNHYVRIFDYIMQSAFFVYLIHIPVVFYFSGLFSVPGIPASGQFFLTLSLSIIICFTVYHYLVRGGYLDKFLKGTLLRPKKH